LVNHPQLLQFVSVRTLRSIARLSARPWRRRNPTGAVEVVDAVGASGFAVDALAHDDNLGAL